MKREILFRGKCEQTREWKYGFYAMQSFGCGFSPAIIQFNGGSTMPVKIDENTLGQYTGLKDCKGQMIFEDDIVKISITGMDVDFESKTEIFIAKIHYSNGSFWFTGGGRTDCNWHFYNESDIEVIGNLTDNPDLLKETA